jgi:hypothetical protein
MRGALRARRPTAQLTATHRWGDDLYQNTAEDGLQSFAVDEHEQQAALRDAIHPMSSTASRRRVALSLAE